MPPHPPHGRVGGRLRSQLSIGRGLPPFLLPVLLKAPCLHHTSLHHDDKRLRRGVDALGQKAGAAEGRLPLNQRCEPDRMRRRRGGRGDAGVPERGGGEGGEGAAGKAKPASGPISTSSTPQREQQPPEDGQAAQVVG